MSRVGPAKPHASGKLLVAVYALCLWTQSSSQFARRGNSDSQARNACKLRHKLRQEELVTSGTTCTLPRPQAHVLCHMFIFVATMTKILGTERLAWVTRRRPKLRDRLGDPSQTTPLLQAAAIPGGRCCSQ
jgi:hypothetical protein